MAIPAGLLCLVVLASAAATGFASPSRKMVEYHELKRKDFSIKLTNWGATIISVVVPDSKGNLADVVLGYDTNTIAGYVKGNSSFGALVGRVANRISGARFSLNGRTYRLYPNNGKNSLHGGHRGFGRVIWTVAGKDDGEYPSVTFYYRSFDGEQGFPGDLDVFVTYKIVGNYQFTIEMEAKPLNKPTPVNLASHPYWNLAGHDSGTILSHTVQIFGSHVTPTDDFLIPTGEIKAVECTPYDFLRPHTVVSRLPARGYDINYALDSPFDQPGGLRRAATVKDGKTGRVLEILTNQPGVQFYTSGKLLPTVGKNGFVYHKHAGLCLETQGFPNSVNQPNFPSQIVNPGQVYKHTMLHKFSFQ